ncbi:disease resistance protein RUN1-like [Populus alba x Populus x berolinensis]|nr:disease resistance protein RUN1-like [Populus alba x Populus x berolinensis]
MAPNHPGKRSRLWHREDIMAVLDEYCSGTEVVEGIVLDAQESEDVVPSTSFAPMTSLQLLKFSGGLVRGHYEHISKALIWLCWHKFSLETLPHKFRLDSLVVLDMQHSNIRELWKEETKCLNNLKVIDLSNSRFFAKTPNFSGLLGLERLILENCASLADIHQSVGELKKLVFLNLKGCSRLKNLPESIVELKSLETMNLKRCTSLKKLPEGLGNLRVLTDLLLDETAVHHLPSTTGFLKKLKKLLVHGHSSVRKRNVYSEEEVLVIKQHPFLPPSLSGLSSLTTLDISYRDLSNNDISINLGSLSSLQDLNLAANYFSELPAGIGNLAKLEKLDLSRCRNLRFISEIPSSLRALVARDCGSLEKVSIQSKTAPDLLLGGCGKLAEIQGLESVENKPVIRMENCYNLSNNFKEILLQVLSKGKLPDVVLPGSDVPHWFMEYQRDRSSSTFRIPPISAGLGPGLIVWTVYAAKRWIPPSWSTSFPTRCSPCSASIRKKKDDNELFYTRPCLDISSWDKGEDGGHSWVIYIPFSRIQGAIEGGDELEVSVKPGHDTIVQKCTTVIKQVMIFIV